MIKRVCRTKQGLREAGERQRREFRKGKRGQPSEIVSAVLVCNSCGVPHEGRTLLNGDECRGVVIPELNDVLCLDKALAYRRRSEPGLSTVDYIKRLRQSNWDARPWDDSQPETEKVPYLYTEDRTDTTPSTASRSA